MIDKRDYLILMEGAGSPRDASARDVAIGIAVSCLTTAVSLWPSVDIKRMTGPVIMFVVVSVFAACSSVFALFAHLRTKDDKGRQSYVDALKRIRENVGIKDEDSKKA